MQKKVISRPVPDFILEIIRKIRNQGFSAHVVGGAVRDMILGKEPEDWDVTSDSSPADIMAIFPKVIPTGIKHSTVSVPAGQTLVEVTRFRSGDDSSQSLEEDLRHRDFTINAMAYDPIQEILVDPWNGLGDLQKGIIRAVEEPLLRFKEDPLRTVRAVRFAAQFDFTIEKATQKTIPLFTPHLQDVAIERIRNEFLKILAVKIPSKAIEQLRKLEILNIILPEILEGYQVKQNRFHRFDIYLHSLKTVDYLPPDPLLRWIGLLHDIAKPRQEKEKDNSVHFYGHEHASAKIASEIMKRWRFSNKELVKARNLIANHMLHDFLKWKPPACRRFIMRVGPENLEELLQLWKADRLAHGTEEESEIEKGLQSIKATLCRVATKNPVLTVNDLAIGGKEVMEIMQVPPGPTVGKILKDLLNLVVEDPDENTPERLKSNIEKMKGKYAKEDPRQHKVGGREE